MSVRMSVPMGTPSIRQDDDRAARVQPARPFHMKEDYSLALDKARGADASEAHGSDEPVSLKAAVKESREASAALADNDAHENIGQDAR